MPGHSCVCRVWVGHRWRPVQAKYVCLAGKQEAGTLEAAAKRQGRRPEGRLGREGGQIWQGLCRVCGGETHWGQSEWDKRGRAQTAGSQQQGCVPARPSHAQGDAGQAEWGAPLGVLWFDWRKPEGGGALHCPELLDAAPTRPHGGMRRDGWERTGMAGVSDCNLSTFCKLNKPPQSVTLQISTKPFEGTCYRGSLRGESWASLPPKPL